MPQRRRDEQLASIPPGGKVQVVEASDQRLVLIIPGSSSGGLGCFAFIWCGFMVVFTTIWMAAGPRDVAPLAFIGLFWLVGIGMTIAAIRMKYERCYLLVDASQAALKRVLFGREKLQTVGLSDRSSAGLAVSYTSNDNPVYRVEIHGNDGALKFGTGLPQADKDWLVDTINLFLRVDVSDDEAAGSDFPGITDGGEPFHGNEEVDEDSESENTFSIQTRNDPGLMTPVEWESPVTPLPVDQIRILEQSAERLRFRLSIYARRGAGFRGLMAVFVTGFIVLWYGTLIKTVFLDHPGFDISKLFAIPFLIAGLPLPFIVIGLVGGAITVDLDDDRLQVRWHAGPVGWRKKFHRDEITSVGLEKLEMRSKSNPRVRSPQSRMASSSHLTAVVRAGERWIPLTTFHDEDTARHVAELVRDRLRM